LLAMIESLLQYARAEAGKVPVKLEPVDLGSLAQQVVSERRGDADEKRLELRATVEPGIPLVESDPRLLRVILGNLVANAIKFTREGHVEVSVARERERHVVTVRDTGPGIPEDMRAVIFE